MIQANNLIKKYKDFEALKDINFHINKNESVALLGLNGSGKSTLIKILTGILYPTKGDVKVLGFIPYKRDRKYLKEITLINPQKSRLIYDVSPMNNFQLFGSAYGISSKKIKERAFNLAKMLNIESKLNNQVRTLSFGERVKVEIITGLLHEPKVVFLDEPFVGLDFISRRELTIFLKSIKQNSQIFMTSHIFQGISVFIDRILLLHNGKLHEDTTIMAFNQEIKNKMTLIIHTKDGVSLETPFTKRSPNEYFIVMEKEKIKDLANEIEIKEGIEKIEIRIPELEDIIETKIR